MTCGCPNAYSYSLIGSLSSLISSAQFAHCVNQEVLGADSPSWEIDSKAVGMSNWSTRREKSSRALETFHHQSVSILYVPIHVITVVIFLSTWRVGNH